MPNCEGEPAVRILVTGGSGLVGKALQAVLSNDTISFPSLSIHSSMSYSFVQRDNEHWIFLSSADGNLQNREETGQIFDKYKPTVVLHLAACVGGLFKNISSQLSMLRSNILINDNVLYCAHKYSVGKVVSCLSTCIFPDDIQLPLTEEAIHNGPPHDSNYGYAYAKRLLDIQSRAYNDEFNCSFASVIPTNIFGPFDNFNLSASHVIPGLIHKAKLAQDKKESFIIAGSGRPLRQFIYSLDLAKLMIWAIREYKQLTPLILSVDETDEISISSAAYTIASTMNISIERVIFDKAKADGQHRKTASNAKLRKLIPDFRFTPFDVAIKETIDWFNKNYHVCRK